MSYFKPCNLLGNDLHDESIKTLPYVLRMTVIVTAPARRLHNLCEKLALNTAIEL